MNSPLFDKRSLKKANGLILNISASRQTFSMSEWMEAAALVQNQVQNDTKLVTGVFLDDTCGNKMHITLIALNSFENARLISEN